MTSSHAYIPDQATIAEIDRIFHGLVAERKAPAYTYGIFDRNGLIHWIGNGVLDWFMRDMTTKELIIMADPNRPRHCEEEFKRQIVQS